MKPRLGKSWPWNTLPDPRPADWGVGMTICIAAHCYSDKSIIMAADMMIGTSEMTADEAARKTQAVGDSWFAQYSGHDISPVVPILRSVFRSLVMYGPGGDSLDNVISAFVNAF